MPDSLQQKVNDALWDACDALRGPVDSTNYKEYILPLLFYKYVSDVWRDARDGYEAEFAGQVEAETLVARKMGRLAFQVPTPFETIARKASHDDNLGETLNKAFVELEEANGDRLADMFQDVDYNSPKLGDKREATERLRVLVATFDREVLDFRPSKLGKRQDVVGNAYMFLIQKFAEGAGKKGGEFFTPPEVSRLLARLVDPQPGDRLYDPTMGSGSLLISVAEHLQHAHDTNDFALYGQEINRDTWALAKMNAVLHGFPAAHFERGDTLAAPKHLEDGGLMTFDVVVANPPFSLKEWGYKRAELDAKGHNRYHRGLPPKTRGDFAFISHMMASVVRDGGRMGVVVPHGVLFRGGREGTIREALIRENLLEAVIGLPEKLFYGTGIPAALLIFRYGKTTEDVLFVDASADFEAGTRQNKLRDDVDSERVVRALMAFRTDPSYEGEEKYAHRATFEEIEANDFNLNVSRYVDTYEPEPLIDLKAVQREVLGLERELASVRKEMDAALAALGLAINDEEPA